MTDNLLSDYKEFVNAIMSPETKEFDAFVERAVVLNQKFDLDVQTLLTAGLGLPGEAGEVADLVKKIMFHQKPFNEENINKFKKELGDVLWYVAAAAIALNFNLDDIINENMRKLLDRYPGGKFDAYRSENRTK